MLLFKYKFVHFEDLFYSHILSFPIKHSNLSFITLNVVPINKVRLYYVIYLIKKVLWTK